MNLSFKNSVFSFLAIGLLVSFCASLISCDRIEYPQAKIDAPKDAPLYTYEPNINKSGAPEAVQGQ